MDLLEMHAAKVAARERRTALVAGAALTLVALGLIVFALVAGTRGPADAGQRVSEPIIAAPAPAPAPSTATPAAASQGADRGRRTTKSDRATGTAGRGVDRVPMTAQSASLFMSIYRRAAEAFGVNWRLIASIHQQETSFSSAPGTYHGLNFARCCAGPMQFNVKNGPVSTWERFSASFRRAERPARYPHPTRHHPSVYDDFDAIMAAAALLRANGAGERLDGSAWLASYHYYGHDFTGLSYADQVLARAVGWNRRGVCVHCPVDAQLAAQFDADFAAPYRAALEAAAKRARAHARAVAREKAEARREARAAKRRADRRAAAAERANAAKRAAERKARARAEASRKAKADAAKKATSKGGAASTSTTPHKGTSDSKPKKSATGGASRSSSTRTAPATAASVSSSATPPATATTPATAGGQPAG